jgi:metal-responsive CopG/Arc/MetJ family transcriptional regulator
MPKKAISAKLDERLLAEADRLAQRLKTSRNRAVEDGLQMWIESKSRELLALEMKKASLATRKESLLSAREWESSLEDGAEDIDG